MRNKIIIFALLFSFMGVLIFSFTAKASAHGPDGYDHGYRFSRGDVNHHFIKTTHVRVHKVNPESFSEKFHKWNLRKEALANVLGISENDLEDKVERYLEDGKRPFEELANEYGMSTEDLREKVKEEIKKLIEEEKNEDPDFCDKHPNLCFWKK